MDEALTELTLDDALKKNENTHTWRCHTGCCRQVLDEALTELTLDYALKKNESANTWRVRTGCG